MSKIPKLASANLKNRRPSPFIAWLRDFMLQVKRDPTKSQPGAPVPESVYMPPNRFPNTQSSRSIEPAMAQGGVHHKLANNYYLERDGRREVSPPTPIYKAIGETQLWQKPSGGRPLTTDQITNNLKAINRGPMQNYGFAYPTPGLGYEWKRSAEAEEYTQRKNPELAKLEKYDKYMKQK